MADARTMHGAERPREASAGERPYGIAPAGYRLPDALRLGRVVLQVSDLERSVRFYEQTLGLRPLEVTGQLAKLGAPQDDEPLIELREKKGAAPVPRGGRVGLYHFAILLPDRSALGRFAGHLAEVGVHPGASDHLVSEALYLNDPDGLGIEIYADRPRTEWRHRQRQLVMATDPLDLRDLLRSAGGERWTGMPAGTRIGHIHLHVGDIDRAAAFYHQALGFDQVVWSYPGALFLSAGGYHHHLGVNTWAAALRPATTDDAGLVEWRIVLPDDVELAAAALSLDRQRFRVQGIGSGDIIAQDPWNITLRLTVAS